MSSAPPQLIADRYRLVEPLGQGGMGRVWKARDEVLHRDVAIKELVPPPGLTEDERREMRERSLREARAIARLNHANVVRVFDVLRTDGDPWIVMEYVPSRSLQDTLASDGPVSPTRAAEIGLGVLGALKSAHRAGVMHRDVKPGNVLLGDDGRVVLTDFGLATVPGDPNVTRTGLVLGSPAYIAPERARDGTAGPEGDLWSLGATLYAAVEGQSPFARPSAIATLAALATEPPPVSRRAGPLKAVLAGLLRKDPTTRINAEVAERLLRRAAGRRRNPGMSLLDGVRRPGPHGPREPGEPRTRIVPLPSPRPAPAAPPTAAPSAEAVPPAPETTKLPAAPPPVAETTKLPAAPPPAAETTKLPSASPPAAETTKLPVPPDEKEPAESAAVEATEKPTGSDAARPVAEPTVVVVPGEAADEAGVTADPTPTAVQPKAETTPSLSPAAPDQSPAAQPGGPAAGPGDPAAQRGDRVARPGGRAAVAASRDDEYGDGQDGRRGPLAAVTAGNGRMWLLGGLVVLLLLALVVVVPLVRGGGSGEEDQDPTSGSAPTSQPAGTPSADSTGAPSTPTPAATTGQPGQPSVTPTGEAAPQLPAGWRMHRDPTGFSVPVPDGWTVSREGPRVKFNDPNSRRFLMIDQTNRPRPDPVADWREQERNRRGNYRNYKLVTIQAVDYWLKAADWEWLHDEGGVRMHVRNRGFVTSSKKAYAIRWDTEAADWDKELATFKIIADGFRPAKS